MSERKRVCVCERARAEAVGKKTVGEKSRITQRSVVIERKRLYFWNLEKKSVLLIPKSLFYAQGIKSSA